MCTQWHHHSHCHSLEDRPSCTTRTTTVLRLGATPSSRENDNERLEQQDELNIVTFCCPPTTKSTTTTTTTTTPYTITDCPPTAEDQLQAVVQKHVETLDRYLEYRPIAAHTQQAFDEFLDQCWMGCQDRHCDDDDDDNNNNHNKDDKNEPTQTEMRLILDAGCGTGRSTLQIAQLQMKYNEEAPNLDNDKNQNDQNNQNSPLVHKMVVVVGVDRSLARLRRNARYHKNLSFSSATTTTFNVLSSLTPNSNKSNPRLENEEEDQDTVVDQTDDKENEDDEEDDEEDDDDKQYGLVQKIGQWSTSSSSSSSSSSLHSTTITAWLIRADLVDFWRLLYAHQIPVHKHYFLYPNPYPKKNRWNRRWYGHALFPLVVGGLQSDVLIWRSNWRQYLVEVERALAYVKKMKTTTTTTTTLASTNTTGTNTTTNTRTTTSKNQIIEAAQQYETLGVQPRRPANPPSTAWTNFEQKYDTLGEHTYELILKRRKGANELSDRCG